MVIRVDKCGWQPGTAASESSPGEFISKRGVCDVSLRLGHSQNHSEVGQNRAALMDQAAPRTLPVYETHLGFKYIGESLDEDKTVPRNENSAGFSFKSHYSEEDGIFARLLAAEAASPSSAELA